MQGIIMNANLRTNSDRRPNVSSNSASFSTNRPKEGNGVRVILVEDHDDTRWAMVRLLETAGYTVCGVSGATEALNLMAIEEFDVTITDIGLPEIDGHELMRQIRQFSAMPGIAISGYGSGEDIRKSTEAGFADHLVKPLNLMKLEKEIQSALAQT